MEKKPTWCDGYNPGEPGYAELLAASVGFPRKYCPLASQICTVVRGAGKCDPQCDLVKDACKDEKYPRQCRSLDVLFNAMRNTCKDKTCATSEFCFCPGNAFKSCKSCHKGCKLHQIDLNGHQGCVEGHMVNEGVKATGKDGNGGSQPFEKFMHRPKPNDGVVVVKGRNLRHARQLLNQPKILRDFFTIMEQEGL